jgi:alanine racemase
VGPAPALIPMVKADGYGLGMAQAVASLAPEDPWGWGVATVEEGLELRGLGESRAVLVVAPCPPGAVADAVARGLILAVSDVSLLERVAAEGVRQGRTATVHLEVDTGMGRAGFDWRTVREWGPRTEEILAGGVTCGGIFTHFHSADREESEALDVQVERFRDAVSALPPSVASGMLHLCNSAAALRSPKLAYHGVRPGIFLYGAAAGDGLPESEEVVTVRARIALIREVPPGTTVGYGATYRARRWERWATVAFGYGDGLPRALSNRGRALVRGRSVPIVGRISMDMTVVDITDVPGIEAGTPVTLVGTDGDERITLEEVAGHADTISYEILTGFTARVPRIWTDEGDGEGEEG